MQKSQYEVKQRNLVNDEIIELEGMEYDGLQLTVERMRRQQFAKERKMQASALKEDEKQLLAREVAKQTAKKHNAWPSNKRQMTLIVEEGSQSPVKKD